LGQTHTSARRPREWVQRSARAETELKERKAERVFLSCAPHRDSTRRYFLPPKSGRPRRAPRRFLSRGGGQKGSVSANRPMRGSPAWPARNVPKAPALSFWKFVMLG